MTYVALTLKYVAKPLYHSSSIRKLTTSHIAYNITSGVELDGFYWSIKRGQHYCYWEEHIVSVL